MNIYKKESWDECYGLIVSAPELYELCSELIDEWDKNRDKNIHGIITKIKKVIHELD